MGEKCTKGGKVDTKSPKRQSSFLAAPPAPGRDRPPIAEPGVADDSRNNASLVFRKLARTELSRFFRDGDGSGNSRTKPPSRGILCSYAISMQKQRLTLRDPKARSSGIAKQHL